MQRHAVRTRERRGLAHQVAAHRERRAGRHADPQHRVPPWIVERLDQSLRVGEDCSFVFDERIGRQAAAALADAHASSQRVKAHSHRARGLDRVIEPTAVREKVEVIRRRRAAGEQELRHRGLGRHLDHFRREPRPDRIETGEPVEERGVLRDGERPRQALEHVVMRVDEARQDDVTRQVDDDVGGCRHVGGGADRGDYVVLDVQAAAANLAPLRIHRDQDFGVSCEQRAWHAVENSKIRRSCPPRDPRPTPTGNCSRRASR